MLDLLNQTTVVYRTFFSGVPGKPGDPGGGGDTPDEQDDDEYTSGK